MCVDLDIDIHDQGSTYFLLGWGLDSLKIYVSIPKLDAHNRTSSEPMGRNWI